MVADASSVHPLHFNAIFYRPPSPAAPPLGISEAWVNNRVKRPLSPCRGHLRPSIGVLGLASRGWLLSNLGDGSTDEAAQKRRLILERKVSKWEHNLSMSLPECDFDTP